MILHLLALCGVFLAVGAVGAVRQEIWGLFLLFPALGAVAASPLAAGVVIATMMIVEGLSGQPIREAYTIEAFWTAAMMAGMAFGFGFAIIAVVAGARKRAA